MAMADKPVNKKLGQLKIEDENVPSGRSSPVFPWSPLPPRRQLGFTSTKNITYRSDTEDIYPNCDANVWMRSCDQEIIEPIAGEASGNIPSWLSGCLIRNGPGSLRVGKDRFSHLFDSSALLHRFNIHNGKVTYQCRFIQTDVYKRNHAAQRIVTTEFGTVAAPDPCQTIFHRVASLFSPKEVSDNSMISVYPFGDELYAFNETPIIHRINKETLDTEGRVDVSKHVSVVHHTSHPHVMEDGTVYNLGMTMTTFGPFHNIVRFSNKDGAGNMFENAEIVAGIPARWRLHPSYMHTFGITANYFVIVEQPLNLSIPGLVKTKLNNEAFAGSLRWYHDEQVQINLVSRKTGHLEHKYFAETFFYLHIINQYETEDSVVIDICSYRDPAMLDCMYIETMKNMQKIQDYAKMFRGRPLRFLLPLKKDGLKDCFVKLNCGKAKLMENGDVFVVPERLCDIGCETPKIYYEKHLGREYRYFYAISSDVDAENPGTIIKVDTLTRTTLTWCESNCYPSEPVFVPVANPQGEDDGVVLAVLIWGKDDTNHVGLLVLDAKTLTELGRTEFMTPSPVPKCLHGWFLPRQF